MFAFAVMAVIAATPANFLAEVRAAAPGDVIRLAPGVYNSIPIKNIAKAAPGVTIDARQATLSNIGFYSASGFTLKGGVWKAPNAAPFYTGLLIQQGSSNIAVEDGVFQDALAAGIGVSGSNHIVITGNVFHTLNDGIDVVGSQFVDIERNQCVVARPSAGHADCVQVWNVVGYPVSSDITIAWNSAIGYEQGFDNAGSPKTLLGTIRANVHDNAYAGTAGTAGGFGPCTDCQMTDNVAFTLTVAVNAAPHWAMTAPAGAAEPIVRRNINGPKN